MLTMDIIQDLHKFEQDICSVIEDFIQYNGNLNSEAGIVITDDLEIIEVESKGDVRGDYYSFANIVEEESEVDMDRIVEIASKYAFVR